MAISAALALGAGRCADMVAHPVDDLGGGGPGREDARDAEALELGQVLVGDDPAAEDHDVVDLALAHELGEPREQRHVGAGEHRQAHGVGVLLDDGLDDLLRRLVQAGVDDLHAGVAQRTGHHLGAPVVPVETRLGDDHPDAVVHHRLSLGGRGPVAGARRRHGCCPLRTRQATAVSPAKPSPASTSPIPGSVHCRSREPTASCAPSNPAESTVTVRASRAPTAASRGRSDGAMTAQSTTAPASSSPPRSASPGRSRRACGPSRVTTVCMPVTGSVLSWSGTSAAGSERQSTVATPSSTARPARPDRAGSRPPPSSMTVRPQADVATHPASTVSVSAASPSIQPGRASTLLVRTRAPASTSIAGRDVELLPRYTSISSCPTPSAPATPA